MHLTSATIFYKPLQIGKLNVLESFLIHKKLNNKMKSLCKSLPNFLIRLLESFTLSNSFSLHLFLLISVILFMFCSLSTLWLFTDFLKIYHRACLLSSFHQSFHCCISHWYDNKFMHCILFAFLHISLLFLLVLVFNIIITSSTFYSLFNIVHIKNENIFVKA